MTVMLILLVTIAALVFIRLVQLRPEPVPAAPPLLTVTITADARQFEQALYRARLLTLPILDLRSVTPVVDP